MGVLGWLFGRREDRPVPSQWLPEPSKVDRASPAPPARQEAAHSERIEWKPSGNGRSRRYAATWGPDWRSITPLAVRLAGEQYCRKAALGFALGNNCSVEIERQPENPHDANAIRVIGLWEHGGRRHREPIGFVPRELAAAIAKERPTDLPLSGAPCRAYVWDDYVDLAVTILEPSARSAWWSERSLQVPKAL